MPDRDGPFANTADCRCRLSQTAGSGTSLLQRSAQPTPGRYRPRDGDAFAAAPYFRRWADWMLTTDKRQRIRLAMSGLAALLMVCCLVVMNSVAAAGLASTAEVRVWTACSVLGLIAVYAAIRSNWSRRFKDQPSPWRRSSTPSPAGGGVCDCRACAGVTLPILAIILMFGIFGLTTRQMLGVLVYSLVAFVWHRAWWPRATA